MPMLSVRKHVRPALHAMRRTCVLAGLMTIITTAPNIAIAQPDAPPEAEAEPAGSESATAGLLTEPLLFYWIYTRDLAGRLGTIDYFDETEIGFRSEGDDLKTIPTSEVLAVVIAREGDRTPDWAWQRLADAMVADEAPPWWEPDADSGRRVDYAPGDDINLWTLRPDEALRELAIRAGIFGFEELQEAAREMEGVGAGGAAREQAGATPTTGDGTGLLAAPWVELVDGQRWSGQLLLLPQGRASTANDPAMSTPTWISEHVGRQVIDLERVHRMKLIGPAPGPAPIDLRTALNDVVVLSNGDRVSGFVADLDVKSRVLRVEDMEGDATTIPLERVAGISVVNPLIEPAGRRVYTQLADEIVVEDVAIDGLTVEVLVPGSERYLDGLHAIAGIVMDAAVFRPLAALPVAEVEAVGDLRFAEPPQVIPVHDPSRGKLAPARLSDVQLHGPVRVTWDLPDNGAERFAALAAVPDVAAPRADFELIIEGVLDGGEARPLFREVMNGTQRLIEIALELDPAFDALRFTVLDHGGGPIQDIVRLHHPRLKLNAP